MINLSGTGIELSKEIANHRLGAFIYGFLSGLGSVMVLWGAASIAVLPIRSLAASILLILLGVGFLASGVCREAYLRGYLLDSPTTRETVSLPYIQPRAEDRVPLTEEQLIEPPIEQEKARKS